MAVSMFSRQPTIINVNQPTRTEYVTREVREYRAPTDQSVALLKEMEQAATDKIVKSVHVGNTQFECVLHVFWDALSDQQVMRAVFNLNGKQGKAEHRYRVSSPKDKDDALTGIRDEIAKVIASEMVGDAFSRLPKF